ncbi:septation protein SpoVG family protein, partial [Staphylococcus capitis]|uniref:septation protein SpoVG family protein n=1 Tax=Staphylococcus capitis TaxID=29388 RepID=UPI0021B4CCF2
MKPLLSITLHQPFLIHHLRLIQANSPLFLPIPTKPTPRPQFPHIPHPINSHIPQQIQHPLIKLYHQTHQLIPHKNPTSHNQ